MPKISWKWSSGSGKEDDNVKSSQQQDNKDNNDDDEQWTNLNQERSLKPTTLTSPTFQLHFFDMIKYDFRDAFPVCRVVSF